MRTALRLSKYEDVLDPKDIYSLIALTSFYNKVLDPARKVSYRPCSLKACLLTVGPSCGTPVLRAVLSCIHQA